MSYRYEDLSRPWLVTHTKNANGVEASTAYDGFGQPVMKTDSLGKQTMMGQRWCEGICGRFLGAVYYSGVSQIGSATGYRFYDLLGREVGSQSSVLNESQKKDVYKRVIYDLRGLVVRTEENVFGGERNITETLYDALGRVVQVIEPDRSLNQMSYKGRTITTINALNQSRVETKNSWGKTVYSRDMDGNELHLSYDGYGNLVNTRDPVGHATKIQYDQLGRKIKMDDPDQGIWTYDYYVDGKLKTQTDAKNQITNMYYDLLGRMTRREDADGGVSNWIYDSAVNGIGQLAEESSSNGYVRRMMYDHHGRVISETETIEGMGYTTRTVYDAEGRVFEREFPSGVKLRYGYDPTLGVLQSVSDSESQMRWEADSYTARGQLVSQKLGSGILIRNTYNPKTGFLNRRRADVFGLKQLDNRYQWDAGGRLAYRMDMMTGVRDDFVYDQLNRLEKTTTTTSDTAYSESVHYDALGNIRYKSDVGVYEYENGKPHAVSQAGGYEIKYDANGNMVSKVGVSGSNNWISYTSFNKPDVMRSDSDRVEFAYGPNRKRFKRVEDKNGDVTTTHYATGYERVMGPDGVTEKTYIGDYAIITTKLDERKVNYLLRDHLGSLVAIMDHVGHVEERLSYDAWGKRRYMDGEQGLDPTRFIASVTTRGYTNHEHVDVMGLIHQNGRVYDPSLARFLSADPFIQAPKNLQNYNRYSYVLNNPLSYTDPSGYFFKKVLKRIKKTFKSIQKAWHKHWKTIVAVGLAAWGGWAVYGSLYNSAMAAGIQAGGGLASATINVGAIKASATVGASVFAGAASGAIMGSTSTALNGGNLRDTLSAGARGAAHGAVTGGMFGAAGLYTGNWVGKSTAYGMAGGVSSKMNGEPFKDGFKLSFGITALTTAAVYMRDVMVEQSRLDPRNASGDSVGFKGDNFKLGGGRFNPDFPAFEQIESPLGGLQGGQGQLGIPFTDIAFEYASGSIQDRLVEAYAGPHDWFNNGYWYNSQTGNIKSGISTAGKWLGEALNLANVATATPFVAASVYPQNLHYMYDGLER